MRGREWLLVTAALATAIAGSALLVASRAGAGPSALSRGSGGLLLARRYLEAQGATVTLLDHEATGLPKESVLLVAFPWERGAGSNDAVDVRDHLDRGGSLVVAFSAGPPQPAEKALLEVLDLDRRDLRGPPPLSPAAWRRFVDEEWTVSPPPTAGGTARLAKMRAPLWLPVPSVAARPLLQGPGQVAVSFVFRRGHGTVVVLPAELLSNCRLAQPASADLLETLRRSLGESWYVDEFHQGLVGVGAAVATPIGPGFALLMGQLVLLYLLAVATLGRRFGVPWRERPPVAGSPATFLRGLGVLHDRLGHHDEAAQALLARVQEIDPRLRLPAGLADTTGRNDARSFVELARDVAKLQLKRRT